MAVQQSVHLNQYEVFLRQIYLNVPIRLCVVDPAGGVPGLLSATDSTKAQVIAKESVLIERGTGTLTSVGAYNPLIFKWETPDVTITMTATTSVEFYQLFTLVGGSANKPRSLTPSAINTSTNVITLASHGLSNGDSIMIVPEAGATLPSPLSGTAIYQAFGITSGTFQISADGLTAVDLSTTGTGIFYLKYANGMLATILEQRSSDGSSPVLISLPAGQSKEYKLKLRFSQA
ncbi:MAG TPA: hypothetical protein DCY88_07755 [Cyanobacteria bacterium UBA11372]|nr:hypothetical protein [Cyanobacteria bacterium UBA11372]